MKFFYFFDLIRIDGWSLTSSGIAMVRIVSKITTNTVPSIEKPNEIAVCKTAFGGLGYTNSKRLLCLYGLYEKKKENSLVHSTA